MNQNMLLQTFHIRCLRSILGMSKTTRSSHIANAQVRPIFGMSETLQEVVFILNTPLA